MRTQAHFAEEAGTTVNFAKNLSVPTGPDATMRESAPNFVHHQLPELTKALCLLLLGPRGFRKSTVNSAGSTWRPAAPPRRSSSEMQKRVKLPDVLAPKRNGAKKKGSQILAAQTIPNKKFSVGNFRFPTWEDVESLHCFPVSNRDLQSCTV